LIQLNLPILEGLTIGQMLVVKFPLTTAPAPTPSENFNPVAVDISNSISLHCLKRPQLNRVCFYHQLSAGGTNAAAIIAHLLQGHDSNKFSNIGSDFFLLAQCLD